MKKLNLVVVLLLIGGFNLLCQVVPAQQSDVDQKDLTSRDQDIEMEKKFVEAAAMKSMMEMKLGQLAQQEATSTEIQELGKTIVKDHTTAAKKLERIVEKKNMDLPATLDEKHQKKVDNFTDKSGEEFDRDFINMMVKDHKKDIAMFEKAQQDVTDPNLKEYIDNTLPVLKEHLEIAENIQEKME